MPTAETSYLAESYMLPCVSKRLMGFDCPGCGLQRSVSLLFEGDFIGAFHMYPAIYAIILLFGFLGLNHFVKVKHSNPITITLLVTSVVLILTNFFLKFL